MKSNITRRSDGEVKLVFEEIVLLDLPGADFAPFLPGNQIPGGDISEVGADFVELFHASCNKVS